MAKSSITMIAQELSDRLSSWNTRCALQEQPVYRGWLKTNFGHWLPGEDFSRLAVETLDPQGFGMLAKDDVFYITWFSPSGVMNTPPEFIAAGLLSVGATANGDFIVVDTRAGEELRMGFVSHDALWEEHDLKAAYSPWRDDLLTFLDRLEASPNYVTLF